MTTNIGQILRQRRLQIGLPQTFVAKKSECHRTYLNRIENKPNFTKNVSEKILEKIALVLGTTLSELMGTTSKPAPNEISQILKPIPVIGYANKISSCKKTAALGFLPRVTDLTDPDAYAVIVGDDSMKPIEKGSNLVVSPILPLKENTLVVAKVGGKYLFRNYQTQGDTIILNTIRNHSDLIVLSKNEATSIHRVWGMTIKT